MAQRAGLVGGHAVSYLAANGSPFSRSGYRRRRDHLPLSSAGGGPARHAARTVFRRVVSAPGHSDHPGCLGHLEQQGGRHCDGSCRIGCYHAWHGRYHLSNLPAARADVGARAGPATLSRHRKPARLMSGTALPAMNAEPEAEIEARRRLGSDFAELVKARLTLLVLLTTAVGFYLGAVGSINYAALFHAVVGTARGAG